MNFTSTRNHQLSVNFEEAVYRGLAPDSGLFVPENFPQLPADFISSLPSHSLLTIANHIISNFISDIPTDDRQKIIEKTLSFPIPLVHLEKNLYLLEVFHGPTLAFKDVGARFMANVLSYFATLEHKKVTILVATSGDTGSAIAHAFHRAPNIDVFILFPANKISRLQEKQMTTFGDNIHPLAVNGTFDDCQRLVKTALADDHIKSEKILTTSNSINIARLLPQMIYHAWGLAQLKTAGINHSPTMVIPCGNLGNLTSAVYAQKIGFHIADFLAASNQNSVFSDYLSSGLYEPRPSQKTHANAMDVGNPSNFERLLDVFDHSNAAIRQIIKGCTISDKEILDEIKSTYESTHYILDPHTAVGVASARQQLNHDNTVIITATAHPAKFPEVIQQAINIDIELPVQLQRVLSLPMSSENIGSDYKGLQSLLRSTIQK
tara:strand:- start:293 stop:1597 length:1305 start_codon:yes stop_codon:yes gene_type:complete